MEIQQKKPIIPHLRSASKLEKEKKDERTILAFKVRLWFSRDAVAAFYPHQAVLTAFSRAVRRANLPMRFTEGFDPHPRITIPYALSVGIPGDGEVMEIELHKWRKPSLVAQDINAFLPRGVKVEKARLVPAKRASVVVTAAFYEAVLPPELCDDALRGIENLLACSKFEVERGEKAKVVDVRKYIQTLELENYVLKFKLTVTLEGTARPREIVEAVLPKDSVDVRLVPIKKVCLELKDAD